MVREWLKVFGVVGLSLVIGLAGGLLYGLVQNPVRYRNVYPGDLAQLHRLDYLRMIAADYTQSGDLESSRERLRRLGFTPAMVAEQANQALFGRAPGARALARLAVDLGAGDERLIDALATPSVTPSAVPSAAPPATPERTIAPSSTPRTAAPTAPPSPSATAAAP